MTLEENYLFTGSDDQTIKIWVLRLKIKYI
jgi:hypothetical protein